MKKLRALGKPFKTISFYVFLGCFAIASCYVKKILDFFAKELAENFNNWQSVILAMLVSILFAFLICIILEKTQKLDILEKRFFH